MYTINVWLRRKEFLNYETPKYLPVFSKCVAKFIWCRRSMDCGNSLEYFLSHEGLTGIRTTSGQQTPQETAQHQRQTSIFTKILKKKQIPKILLLLQRKKIKKNQQKSKTFKMKKKLKELRWFEPQSACPASSRWLGKSSPPETQVLFGRSLLGDAGCCCNSRWPSRAAGYNTDIVRIGSTASNLHGPCFTHNNDLLLVHIMQI